MSAVMPLPEPHSGAAGGPARAAEPPKGEQVARTACERPWAAPEARHQSSNPAGSTPSLATILASLPPVHAEEVRRHLAIPQWQARALRLAARDGAIRDAAALVAPGLCRAQAAMALATALDRYVTCGAWAMERDLAELPETASARRRALHRILRLNSGKTWGLSSRTINNVLKGERGAE